MVECPMCHGRAGKILYMGFPGWFCASCSGAGGAASYVMMWFDWLEGGGWTLLSYEGSYWRALWRYLTGKGPECG